MIFFYGILHRHPASLVAAPGLEIRVADFLSARIQVFWSNPDPYIKKRFDLDPFWKKVESGSGLNIQNQTPSLNKIYWPKLELSNVNYIDVYIEIHGDIYEVGSGSGFF